MSKPAALTGTEALKFSTLAFSEPSRIGSALRCDVGYTWHHVSWAFPVEDSRASAQANCSELGTGQTFNLQDLQCCSTACTTACCVNAQVGLAALEEPVWAAARTSEERTAAQVARRRRWTDGCLRQKFCFLHLSTKMYTKDLQSIII